MHTTTMKKTMDFIHLSLSTTDLVDRNHRCTYDGHSGQFLPSMGRQNPQTIVKPVSTVPGKKLLTDYLDKFIPSHKFSIGEVNLITGHLFLNCSSLYMTIKMMILDCNKYSY